MVAQLLSKRKQEKKELFKINNLADRGDNGQQIVQVLDGIFI